VYLARSGKGNARRVKARSVHAPARRLARTTISLGPDEGIAFGLRAVRYSPHTAVLFCVSSHVCTCSKHHCSRIYDQLENSQAAKLRAIDAQSCKGWRFFCMV